MEGQKYIKDYIVEYLLEEENKKSLDPVLAEWLAENDSNRKEFDLYKKIWREASLYQQPDAFDVNLAWEKINRTNQQKIMNRQYFRTVLYVVSGIAASLLVLFALSFIKLPERDSTIQASMKANYGNRSEIVLPDGSTVKLNSGSNVSYVYNPQKKVREVEFQGEGFFDVSKNKEPFVVNMAGGFQVKVWGTSFNLQAYEDDPIIQASLIEGCIELENGKEKLLMKPGEMAIIDKQANKIKPVKGILSHSYGWLHNKLYMENMPLSQVCKYLERWYDVNIILQSGLGDSIYYNGVIQEETVTDVMDALSRLSNISYHVKGRNISITSK